VRTAAGRRELDCTQVLGPTITVYLLNGGLLEYAQQMAAHV